MDRAAETHKAVAEILGKTETIQARSEAIAGSVAAVVQFLAETSGANLMDVRAAIHRQVDSFILQMAIRDGIPIYWAAHDHPSDDA